MFELTLGRQAVWNGVGQPIEETMALTSLIYEGIFETFPGVKIVIVHGGGYLPDYTRRLDRNYTMHPSSAQNIKKIPTETCAACITTAASTATMFHIVEPPLQQRVYFCFRGPR